MEPAGQPAQSLSPDNPKFPQKVREILHKAQSAWLKNTEVCDLLLHYAEYNLPVARDPPNLPPGGSLFLFDRRAVRFFRKDGHNWRKKADGKTVRETHEKLKVGNVEMLNCYYAHADTEEGAQHSTRLQRRCYWLLESEDDIVLVHYLNIDKAKGKTEDSWTTTDPEMGRRPGFTVTSGGVHGMQGLPGLQGLATGHPILSQHPQHPQHPIDPYVPLMPSLSLDSFFASYDERELAAQRAHAPPPMMENVLPAWEDLSNGPSGSLQGGPDWRAMLRGDSLNISEAPPPALVEHGANIMMIEQGVQPPEGWAQDIPVAMRTPSLEARQARAAAMMRQNMELQQRQSSLERRAAYQKSLLAANRDQMQQAAAAAMLQQAQSSQANGMPLNLNTFHQRLVAAARQGPPNAGGQMPGQLPGLFRSQDVNAAQAAALAGLAGQMQPPGYSQQMPPPPPPQRPFMPPTSSGAAAPGAGMAGARLPPLQQGAASGFQGRPSAGPVAADWARAYREQQHKAAQAAIARSAKWGTTEPPLRPTAVRQGSAPGPLDVNPSPSGSANPSPGKPPLAGAEGYPKMSKLDALLLQQQQQQQHSGSSSGEGKQTMSSPGALGAHSSPGSDHVLQHASSAGQLGAIGTQVKIKETASECTVTGTPRGRSERQGSKVAKALALEAQLRTVDGAVMEQLQSARSDSGRSASLDSRVQKLEEDLENLEASSRQLLQESAQEAMNGATIVALQEPATSATQYLDHPSALAPSGLPLQLQDFSPEWDFTLGGSKVIVTCREVDGEVTSNCPICIMFDKEQVPAARLQSGVYRCHAPPHEAGTVGLCITYGDGRPRSNVQPFTYRATPQTARAQDDLARAAIPDRDLQLRLIHMLMGSSRGATSSSTAVPASPSNSSDSNTQKHNASPTPTTASHMSDSAVDEDPNALQSSSDDMREKLLQSLLERRLKQFTTDVKEGRALLGHGWSPSFAVNQRAQSGLALIHILAALGYDWGLQLLIPLGAQLDLQDAWGRTALHWAAAYACEATVVLLLVRGAQPAPLSHGGEAQGRACPADMAAGNGHSGIAAFLSEQALLRLAKDNNISLDDSADARDDSMSLRKRARSLRRADSASELPLLREAMAAPEGASRAPVEDSDEGTSPKELVVRVSKSAERVRQAQARAACRRAVMERQSMRRHKKEGDAVARIESSLETWQHIQQMVQQGIEQSPSDAVAQRLARLGDRITRVNACLRDAIKRSLGCAGSSTGLSMVDEAVALPLTGSSTVLDYGSDSDATGTNGDSLLRRRSLIRLRESRRRDSITKIKGFESDASIRQFLAHGRESSKADEGGPSLLDIRELRSLSLSIPSFSLLGPPIGVSLPDCDLRALRDFIKAGTSTKKASVLQKANRVAFGGVTSSSNTSEPVPTGVGAECNPDAGILQRAVAHMEALVEDGTGHAQYVRLRQAYTQLTTTQPWGNFKQARRGSLSYAV